MNANNQIHHKRHLRGSWIATVINLDWPSTASQKIVDQTERVRVQKSELIAMLDEAVDLRMNALFFQVKPCSDAFYRSSILPWSSYLTGTLGKDPGFDPLQFVIDEAHRRNLELHAWFNPYRVSMNTRQSTIDQLTSVLPGAPVSVYAAHPQWIGVASDRFVLDPGIPEARAWVVEGIMEVARNYDIDGIQFDDYFYNESSSSKLNDDATFALHGQNFSSKADWRRNNTFQLISELSQALRQFNPAIKFGISPAGVWRNKSDDPQGSDTSAGIPNFDAAFADTRRWVHEELIDYIAPQVYWSFGLKAAQFDIVTRWWADTVQGKNVHLYIGEALYKVAVPSQREPEWTQDNGVSQINKQLAWNIDIPQIQGSLLFRHLFLRAPAVLPAIASLREEVWRSEALVPTMPWKGGSAPAPPACVQQIGTLAGTQVKWHESAANPPGKTCYYALYRFPKGQPVDITRAEYLVATCRRDECLHVWTDPVQHDGEVTYAVTALDRGHFESAATTAA